MFEVFTSSSERNATEVVRAMNDFLDASGYGVRHTLRAEVSTDPRLGEHADIAILNNKMPPTQEQQDAIVTGLQESLSKVFEVDIDKDDRPEFLKTISGRIPTRGTPGFKNLNPDAHERYAELADLDY